MKSSDAMSSVTKFRQWGKNIGTVISISGHNNASKIMKLEKCFNGLTVLNV